MIGAGDFGTRKIVCCLLMERGLSWIAKGRPDR